MTLCRTDRATWSDQRPAARRSRATACVFTWGWLMAARSAAERDARRVLLGDCAAARSVRSRRGAAQRQANAPRRTTTLCRSASATVTVADRALLTTSPSSVAVRCLLLRWCARFVDEGAFTVTLMSLPSRSSLGWFGGRATWRVVESCAEAELSLNSTIVQFDRWDNAIGVCDRFDTQLDDGALGNFPDGSRWPLSAAYVRLVHDGACSSTVSSTASASRCAASTCSAAHSATRSCRARVPRCATCSTRRCRHYASDFLAVCRLARGRRARRRCRFTASGRRTRCRPRKCSSTAATSSIRRRAARCSTTTPSRSRGRWRWRRAPTFVLVATERADVARLDEGCGRATA